MHSNLGNKIKTPCQKIIKIIIKELENYKVTSKTVTGLRYGYLERITN